MLDRFCLGTVLRNYCVGKELFIIMVLLSLVSFILNDPEVDHTHFEQHNVEHQSLAGSRDLLHITVYIVPF